MLRLTLSLTLLVLFACDVSADRLRSRHTSRTSYTPSGVRTVERTREVVRGNFDTHDALDEVNAARARRGLRPYLRDAGLTQAAQSAATYRATHRIFGHVSGGMGDFRFLPPGSHASAAGCGALEPSWGFRSCAMFESWTYAGAATVRGADGRLYHHLFVR